MNSKTFVYIAAIFSLLGLIVNVAFDLDNVYDMTMVLLWILALVFAVLGATMGKKPMTPAPDAGPKVASAQT